MATGTQTPSKDNETQQTAQGGKDSSPRKPVFRDFASI